MPKSRIYWVRSRKDIPSSKMCIRDRYTVTSSDPDTVAVEQVMSFWVAVAKAEGSAEITASNQSGETGALILTVGPKDVYKRQAQTRLPLEGGDGS